MFSVYTMITEFTMSHDLSARVQDDLYDSLESIAHARHRKFSEIIQEALRHYVEEYAEYQIALDRLSDHTDKIIDEAELKHRLGWK